MVVVTWIDNAGFVRCVESDTGGNAGDELAEFADELRTIKNVYGTAAQQQAFWRRINDRGNTAS